MKRRFTLSVSALVSLAVAGCGSGSTPPSAPSTTNTAQSNPTPGLTGVAPATVVHGSGNQYLTAIGGGFIPGAVVLWNGVPRTTTYIDASHLQFAVAAADVAASQAVSLTAENPGSGASPSLTLPIN